MIKLIDRKILSEYEFSSYVIGSMQEVFKQNQLMDAENDKEINELQQYITDKYDMVDIYSNHFEEEFVTSIILHPDVGTMEEYLYLFPREFINLIDCIGINRVIIALGKYCDWFCQKNRYKPVKQAMDELKKITISKTYFGAFEVSSNSLFDLINILFWLGRCNASLPYIHIISEEKKLAFLICKYGNLHIDIYSEDMERKIREICTTSSFQIIEHENEFL